MLAQEMAAAALEYEVQCEGIPSEAGQGQIGNSDFVL
jgi:hypothetical protein